MEDTRVESTGAGETPPTRTPRRAAISALVGGGLEYYDFFIYGTAAALVFPRVFFPAGNPTAATIASLATFGVAYVARPFGSALFGHLGDTLGRKRVLLITLFGMGAATFLIGVLPTYEQIGIAAPILLLVLRLLQGLAVSGEQSSASSATLEHASGGRRAFFTSFTMAGAQSGNLLASAVFLPIALLPESALLSWGWRIPFLLSAVIVVVGLWIRRAMKESPAFEEERRRSEVPTAPLKLLFAGYTPDVLRVMVASLTSVITSLFGTYALAYGVTTMGLSRGMFLWLAIVSYAASIPLIPLFGILADRIGRKPVFAIGTIGSGGMIWPFLWAISERNLPLLWVFGIVMIAVFQGAYFGSAFALWSEQFGTKVRMSGVAVGTQVGFAIGGFAPAIATALAGPTLDNWLPVAVFGCVTLLLAFVAGLLMRETVRKDLDELGRPRPTPAGESTDVADVPVAGS